MWNVPWSRIGLATVFMLSLSTCATDKVVESMRLTETPTPGFKAGPVYFLPKALVAVDISRTVSDKGDVSDTFVVGQLELIADTSQAFRINYDPNAFSDDKVQVEMTAPGLITGVNTLVESKTIDFAKKFPDFVSAFTPPGIKADDGKPKPFALKFKIDPHNESDKQRVLSALSKVAPDLRLEVTRVDTPYAVASSADQRPSLWLPLPAIYRLSLVRGNEVIGESVLTVPEKGKAFGLNLSRAAFTKADTKLTASGGYLTKYDYSKGSEAVGAASLPVEAAKALVGIPAALFQFKVSSLEDDKALADARKELFESEVELAKAKIDSSGLDELEKLSAQTALLEAQKEVLNAQLELMKVQKQLEDEDDTSDE